MKTDLNKPDEMIGQTYGSWHILEYKRYAKIDPIYQCKCNKCGFVHAVTKANLVAKVACPTCPTESKSPVDELISTFGGVLGITEDKRKEINAAFEKLNQPEFKNVYASLERASGSIKNVMNGKAGAPDVARKVLEVEASNLKSAFDELIKEGKITEEEARILKTDINSSANMQKLKTMLEVMKQQTHDPKKTKI